MGTHAGAIIKKSDMEAFLYIPTDGGDWAYKTLQSLIKQWNETQVASKSDATPDDFADFVEAYDYDPEEDTSSFWCSNSLSGWLSFTYLIKMNQKGYITDIIQYDSDDYERFEDSADELEHQSFVIGESRSHKQNKKKLYESIMNNVAIEVKKTLNKEYELNERYRDYSAYHFSTDGFLISNNYKQKLLYEYLIVCTGVKTKKHDFLMSKGWTFELGFSNLDMDVWEHIISSKCRGNCKLPMSSKELANILRQMHQGEVKQIDGFVIICFTSEQNQ